MFQKRTLAFRTDAAIEGSYTIMKKMSPVAITTK